MEQAGPGNVVTEVAADGGVLAGRLTVRPLAGADRAATIMSPAGARASAGLILAALGQQSPDPAPRS